MSIVNYIKDSITYSSVSRWIAPTIYYIPAFTGVATCMTRSLSSISAMINYIYLAECI